MFSKCKHVTIDDAYVMYMPIVLHLENTYHFIKHQLNEY